MTTDVLFSAGDAAFLVGAMTGREALGEASDLELELTSPEFIDPKTMLGEPAVVTLEGVFSQRSVHGIIARFSTIAAAEGAVLRRYKARVVSELHRLSLRSGTRVFQELTPEEIVRKLLAEGGVPPDRIAVNLGEVRPPRRYVVQFGETDAAFLRRLCEEEGLYFRFEARDRVDAFVLEDGSTFAPDAVEAKLVLADDTGALRKSAPAAFAYSAVRRRRPGSVTLRDHDPDRPALALQAKAASGTAIERDTEVYAAPGRFRTPREGEARARVALERLRADARVVAFETNAVSLAPGLSVEIEAAADHAATASRPEGKLFVVAVEHAFHRSAQASSFRVRAIPSDVPYRLPAVTPRPVVAGVQSAIVTGAPGEEIHTGAGGHVKVRFPWDAEQPADDTSSLPVRVMQPNMPGSMLIPRVGWEVAVAFEDGDPDRPYVLGRLYNGRHPPPVALPENKTMTVLSTVASPGGARANSVTFDDAAGRQHMVWNAGFAKTTTVDNDMLTQTVGFETVKVGGSQSWTIGANETLSVTSTSVTKVGSQTATVGGNQTILIKASGRTTAGSETVLVGGALLEQVGNPVAGAAGFAESAVLAGVGNIPVVGSALSRGYTVGRALAEGYQRGGVSGALSALGQQAVNAVADQVPGGDAIVAAADGAGLTPWSERAQRAAGAAEAGGGTGGAAGAGPGGAQAAPGHRKTIVDGAMAESIGAASTVTTPGSIKWTTLGPSSFAVGGGHSTRAVRISRLTGGVSSDTAASISIQASKAIGRNVKGALKTSIAGALTSDAGGAHVIKAGGDLTINVGGSMELEGSSVVFAVGSSTLVAVHSGGVLFKATNVTINGKAVQSGKATNSE